MKYIALMVLALTLPVKANAAVILLTPGDAITSGNETGQSMIDDAIALFLGISTAEWKSTELYKSDVDSGDSGPAQGWYTTTFSNTPADPSDADIDWNGGSFISDPSYLLVRMATMIRPGICLLWPPGTA